MQKTTIRELFKNINDYDKKEVNLAGWVRTMRDSKTFGFIELNDGSFFKNAQIVFDNTLSNFEDITKLSISSSVKVTGTVLATPEAKQPFEIKATNITIECLSPNDYPLQKKGHTVEFLREQAYLRPRTNLFNAVFRIRSVAAIAIHNYFQSKGYIYFHAPLITANDGEGAGEMFQVTTLDLDKVAQSGKVDYDRDFFGKHVGLTVTGQLEAEAYALAYGKVYTFGPSFRAENSNTKTHASEFWMIEPEIAFCDLDELMDIEEDMLKYIVKDVLEKCPEEMEFLNKFVATGLIEKLQKLLDSKFTRISHEDVITILKEAKVDWEFKPEYGEDIAKEHEKYITEHFDGPVFITTWPKDIKAFYMKQNPDGKTVAAVDLEVPGAGELMGGSQREENYDKLLSRMHELGMHTEELDWYLNLRKYGSCVHSGFGMGFERLLIYLTGVENIRDVIPFPRTPGNCDF